MKVLTCDAYLQPMMVPGSLALGMLPSDPGKAKLDDLLTISSKALLRRETSGLQSQWVHISFLRHWLQVNRFQWDALRMHIAFLCREPSESSFLHSAGLGSALPSARPSSSFSKQRRPHSVKMSETQRGASAKRKVTRLAPLDKAREPNVVSLKFYAALFTVGVSSERSNACIHCVCFVKLDAAWKSCQKFLFWTLTNHNFSLPSGGWFEAEDIRGCHGAGHQDGHSQWSSNEPQWSPATNHLGSPSRYGSKGRGMWYSTAVVTGEDISLALWISHLKRRVHSLHVNLIGLS